MNAQQNWSPYAGSGSIILAIVLLLITGGLLYFALQLRHPVAVKRPGMFLAAAIVVIWLLSVTTWVAAIVVYVLAIYRQVGHIATPHDYIAPVTLTLLLVAFFLIAIFTMRRGFWVALVSAIVGTIAAPLIFELPFDLIVMWRTYPPNPGALFTLLFFLPLLLIEISSFALLTLSPAMKLSRYTLFALAGMFLVFAVWAVSGFAFPATALPITLNVISKILAFVTGVSLFLPTRQNPTQDAASSTAPVIVTGTEPHLI